MPANREYRLLNRILQTDYAEAFRAVAIATDGLPQPAYIHVLAPRISEPEVLLRIKQHVDSLSEIRFPNLIVPWEVGNVKDRWALAMSGPSGHHLDHVLARCRARELMMTVPQAVHLVAEAANELSALHRGGLCHGGLGPDDMVLCFNGSVGLHCNGLRFVLEGFRPTRHLAQRGRKRYRAPELSRGGPPGPASDVFALGAVAFELLTGQAFEGALRPGSALRADASLLPSRLDRRIPTAFDPILLRAIEPVPSRRYEDAESFRDALWEYLDGMGEVVTPAELLELASSVLPNQVMPRTFDPDEKSSGQIPIEGVFELDTMVAAEVSAPDADPKGSRPHLGSASPVASYSTNPMPAAYDEDEIRTDAGDPPDDFFDAAELLNEPSAAEPYDDPKKSSSLFNEHSQGGFSEPSPLHLGTKMQVEQEDHGSSLEEERRDELAPRPPDPLASRSRQKQPDFTRQPTQDGTVFVSAGSGRKSSRASAGAAHRSPQGEKVFPSTKQDQDPMPSMQTRLVSNVRSERRREIDYSTSPARHNVQTALHAAKGRPGMWDWMTIPVPLALVVAAALVIASLAFAVGRLTAPSIRSASTTPATASSTSSESSPEDGSLPSSQETGGGF